MHAVYQQRQAINSILALGGIVFYTGEPSNVAFEAWKHRSTSWFEELSGARKPYYVALSGKAATDGVLRNALLPLKSLETIELSDVSVTDEGLAELESLTSLKRLICTRNRATDASFAHWLCEDSKFEFLQTPFMDALDYIREYHSYGRDDGQTYETFTLPIIVDAKDLATVGIDVQSLEITASVPSKPLTDALEDLLSPLGMDWVGINGQMVITSRQTAKEAHEARDRLRKALSNIQQLGVD